MNEWEAEGYTTSCEQGVVLCVMWVLGWWDTEGSKVSKPETVNQCGFQVKTNPPMKLISLLQHLKEKFGFVANI